MQDDTTKITDGLYWAGITNDESTVYDIMLETKQGTSCNAYVIKGSEKTALIDTVNKNHSDEYIKKISSIVDIETIDYLILNHTEPDHSGALGDVLDKNPDITIVATAPGLTYLKHIMNTNFKSLRAREQMKLSLGDMTLMFYMKENLDWPDTMFTYIVEKEILLTGDFMSAQYASKELYAKNVDKMDKYQQAYQAFFDTFLSPYKPSVIKALNLINDLNLKWIAPSHGVIIDDSFMEEALDLYREWSQGAPKNNRQPLVIIPYVSAYGFTKKIGEAIKEGITEGYQGGVDVEMHDLLEETTKDVIACIDDADAFLIGTNTILGDAPKPVWDLIAALNPDIHGKKFASAFGSYGWSGEAVKFVMERLKQLKMFVGDGLRIRLNPSDKQTRDAKSFGKNFAEFMQDKMRLT